MNIIKIRALNTEDYITAVLHGRRVCMLMHVRMLECVKSYHSLFERLRQIKKEKKDWGHLLFKAGLTWPCLFLCIFQKLISFFCAKELQQTLASDAWRKNENAKAWVATSTSSTRLLAKRSHV